ncbi:MAG: YrhA family protein [Bacteroidota bacterium]|nr:YrhA family protein [Bacteroidota bacterium]
MWKEKIEEMVNIYAKYKKKLNSSCSENHISEFQEEVYEDFGYKVPEEYTLFLSYINGVRFNGLVIYGVDDYITECNNNEDTGFIESNELWYENAWQKEYMFFGHSSITWYCYDMQKKTYLELDKPSGARGIEYSSFEELLDKALFNALPSDSKKKFTNIMGSKMQINHFN